MSLEAVFVITAIVFTFVGWYFGFKSNNTRTVSLTIDSLIEQGYIKTRRNASGELEILKYNQD